VTGTFDNWSKSEKLIKTGDVFEKNVTLSSADEKIYYKVRGGNKQICRSIGMLRTSRAHCYPTRAFVSNLATMWYSSDERF